MPVGTPELMLQHPPIESRDERIRKLFIANGSQATTAEHARACIAEGIYTADELASFQLARVQADVRHSLRQLDKQGLPYAGQTTSIDDSGAHVWKARQMWMFDDYELNVNECREQIATLQNTVDKLVAECEERFRRKP